MNERIQKFAEQCYVTGPLTRDGWPEYTKFDEQKFANLIIEENINFINKEIDRLCEYQRSLPVWDENKRDDCDLVIDKCFDIIEGLKQHFGIKE